MFEHVIKKSDSKKPIIFFKFVRLCIKMACRHSKSIIDIYSFIAAILLVVIGVFNCFKPLWFPEEWFKIMTPPMYLIPAIILAILVASFRFIISPFWAYQEREEEAKKKEAELNLQILEQKKIADKIKIEAQKEKLELENKIKELTTPKFELTFKDSQNYVRFTLIQTYQSGQHTPSQEYAYYVRVKLTNISTSPVKNIRITLLNVEFLVNGKFVETDYADQLALGGTKSLIEELSPGTHAYIDVLSIKEQNNEVKIESLRQLFAYAKLFKKAGVYKLDIQANADDCPSSKISLKFTYDRAGRFIRSDIKAIENETI